MNPEDLTLAAAANLIRARSLSPLEYARALLARIDRIDPQVRAWVTIDREAVLAEARACEAEAAKGHFRGPFHGVPLGIKDIFYTKGLRTTMGASVFRGFVPDRDAEVVANLKRAGAIVLGKTVTTVFANLDPGPTRNPWNLAHTPGGSSSGSAAAVAARMCPAALGTQTVGSVGRPAAFNGIVSYVPPQERVSLRGVFPLAWSLDHVGFFARSVEDLRLLGDVPRIAARREPFRMGVVRDFFDENATDEAKALNDALANKLAGAGFEVGEANLPAAFDLAGPILRTILRAETSAIHEELFRDHPEAYGPKIRSLIETGKLIPAIDYLRARRMRRIYQREMAALFDRFDVLMTPAARGTAPEGIATTGDPVMNGPWTLTNFPIMTLPHALGANGLPVGVQLCSREAELLFEIAGAVEKVVEFEAGPLQL